MMYKKVRIIQIGCGKMAKYTMKYAIENGAQIVGAIDIDENIIGKDIGEIIGGDRLGVKITPLVNAERLLTNLKPDICIITTMSLMSDVKDALLMCANLGINAITTCEEAFYPWNSSPTLTKKLNTLAKKTGCTITGSGYQDVFWGNIVTDIAGATNSIIKIKGSSSYNVEDYGIALAQAHGAGLTLNEFKEQIASVDDISDDKRDSLINKGIFNPSYMWNVNGWIVAKLGLTVIGQTQKCIPQIAKEDITSSTLDMTIKSGDVTGMSALVTTITDEGITIESECIGKVYSASDIDKNEWTVYGEPDTTLVISKPDTVKLTCATVVNRIPDVLNADSGFISTDKFNNPKYLTKHINEHVR